MQAILSSPKLGAFIISTLVVVMFGALMGYAMRYGLQDNAPLNQITGAMIVAFTGVVNYWIGSSASSKDKDLVIAKQADTSATATAVAAQAAGVKP